MANSSCRSYKFVGRVSLYCVGYYIHDGFLPIEKDQSPHGFDSIRKFSKQGNAQNDTNRKLRVEQTSA